MKVAAMISAGVFSVSLTAASLMIVRQLRQPVLHVCIHAACSPFQTGPAGPVKVWHR